MSSVTLTCMPDYDFSDITYQWDTSGCYTHPTFNNGYPTCFPHNQRTQSVTGTNLNAEDAGTITCTAFVHGLGSSTSRPFTLRISGEQLVYCVIACIVYCKQCILLLLATCYCCIIYTPVALVCITNGIFIVGVALLSGNHMSLAHVLTDYSYINARDGYSNGATLGLCMTGLGPSFTDNNSALGGLYFSRNRIPNRAGCSSSAVQPRPQNLHKYVGVISILQCGNFSTAEEGIYTCTMMSSSFKSQSDRFGIYFNGRSEHLIFPSLNHLVFLYTAAPVINTLSSSTVTVTIGSSLTLSCTSRGSPPDIFTWRKDNDPTVLQSTSITAVNYTSTSAVFHADYSIDNVTTSDSGTYTCTVTNPIGSDSTTITAVISELQIW